MATTSDKLKRAVESKLDKVEKEKLKANLDTSNFDFNAVIRGMQLTLVGAQRALQNPSMFTSDHYKQAAIAVAVGIAIRILISLPTTGIRIMLWFTGLFFSLDKVHWDDTIINGLHFIEEYVLQVPFFLMTLMRYIVPTLDNLFMISLQWVDLTYVKKHRTENPDDLRAVYYPNLKEYKPYKHAGGSTHTGSTAQGMPSFVIKSAKKGVISLAIFALSFVPLVGRFVLPAASFYTFNSAVGLGPAAAIFGAGIFLPRRYLVAFLQTYFASRSLMRELLEPYFARIHFTKEQKKAWFRSREGVLFGFGLGFYILVKVPLVGVLIYGIAEASTAYLITKITDAPPAPEHAQEYVAGQLVWRNKHEFLTLDLSSLDHVHSRPVNDTKN